MLVRDRSETGQQTNKSGRLTSSRAGAVRGGVCGDAVKIGARGARLSRAVANTKPEVLIGTETGDISRVTAAQGLSLANQVRDAGLLASSKVSERRAITNMSNE